MRLDYIDRFGIVKKYSGLIPGGFFSCQGSPSCPSGQFISAFDPVAGKTKEFCVDRVNNVVDDMGLLEALIDPSTFADFWTNTMPQETNISIFDQLHESIDKLTDIPDKDQFVLDWLRANLPVSTTPLAGPSTPIEHEAYTVYVDGIPIYFDSLEDSAVTLAREIIAGARLPKILKDIIVGIQIVEEDAPGGPDVVGMSADGFITIYGDRQVDIGVIAHEASHDFAVGKWGDSIPPETSDYVNAINSGEPPISEYSLRNKGEDFAEAVRLYVTDPAALQKTAPLRYKAIERLMTDKEYGG